ncbi:unnamed protein product [Polarella glacialis]|uniref:PARP-type domain-containing protein n=1 Tax=Polarella glacialis TaxID=89957 RepID=A0A813DC17_POLGL|nr:unnamed protein product [Polarella glacialis]CAE8586043.1 unnamed protein product [Polarella glacialis]CAE8616809.1 unnamed protein product [Polarella glacialis]|mmetsp:Transcript_6016/g.11307  ORF Transcript_6016/g.11307 Transcript_6016/m.11307 type:complete len:167 (-) Transcript_6016:14-514(-)
MVILANGRFYEFEVEYAKSSRAACKVCSGTIAKDVVRVGFKGDEHTVDGESDSHKATKWYHFQCFPRAHDEAWFQRHLPEEVADEVLASCQALKPSEKKRLQSFSRLAVERKMCPSCHVLWMPRPRRSPQQLARSASPEVMRKALLLGRPLRRRLRSNTERHVQQQ